MRASVTETCGCGARFVYQGDYFNSAATAWRKWHRCTLPPEAGRCGQPSNGGGRFKQVFCELRAGHAGWHEAEQAQWGYPLMTTPTQTDERGSDE